MAEIENHFTVFIRLPFNRGDFVDPPSVAWSAAKERALWDVISRQAQGKANEIDWHALATQFEVTQPFILQQAAWLYERQLSQVRAQLRKVGNRQSATPSPAPGSMTSSMVGGHAMKRASSGGSRVPSRLSMQHVGSPNAGTGGSTPPTPAKSRTSLPLRGASAGVQPSLVKAGSTSSRPLSRQTSKEENPTSYTSSRRGSVQQQPPSRSPGPVKPQTHDSDSGEDVAQSKFTPRRANPSSTQRRTPSLRKEVHSQAPRLNPEDEDDDSPNFLPFAADTPIINSSRQTPTSPQDPSATLRGGFTVPQRPHTHRRSTSERIISPSKPAATATAYPQNISSSSSSLSASQPALNPNNTNPTSLVRNPYKSPSTTVAATLSPRQQAALRHRHGSESSPSMGSSFSDLDDASVTQSALEEALMSNMGNTTNTMASRVTGIGQALRSRYFDARQGQGAGVGPGQGAGLGNGNALGQGLGQQPQTER